MQIYMKDGKALKVTGGGGYLAPKIETETWVLGTIGTIADGFEQEATFVSNGHEFSKISYSAFKIFYDTTPVTYKLDITSDGGEWVNANTFVDQAYLTLAFVTPPTGDLLTWLQVNGTKQ